MGAVIPRPASWLVSEYFRMASKCCQQQTFALPVDSINQDPVELDMGIPIMSPFAFKRVVCIHCGGNGFSFISKERSVSSLRISFPCERHRV